MEKNKQRPGGHATKHHIRMAEHLDAMLSRMRTKDGALLASLSPKYRDAFFGRDSIEAAEDLLLTDPEIAKSTILRLIRLQGVKNNPASEEEPGKIIHEYRQMYVDGHRITRHSQTILHELGKHWGGSGEQLAYYGSMDATPMFIRLVGWYCQTYGPEILHESVFDKDGELCSVLQGVRRSLAWLVHSIDKNPSGMLEVSYKHPYSQMNQVWMDSKTAYLHEDGTLVNYEDGFIPLELQAYAYDALQLSATIFQPFYPRQAITWHKRANRLQHKILARFWQAQRRQFAYALDRHPASKRLRPMLTPSSNEGLLLDSMLFDSLPVLERRKYVSALVSRIYSEEFMTDVGIRCRGKSAAELVNFQDYHGSWAVWPKQTYDIARGLRRQGFFRLARQLETRLLNGISIAGHDYEFFYVAPDGTVLYDPKKRHAHSRPVQGADIPETEQAWTVSAAKAASEWHAVWKAASSPLWRSRLETTLLARLPCYEVITTQNMLIKRRKESRDQEKTYEVDFTAGQAAYKRWAAARHISLH